MIISYFDSKEFEGIKKAHPFFGKAFDALAELVAGDVTDGRHDVAGDDAYIMVSTYETNPVNEERRFETHRDYIDIQLLLEGRELIGFAKKEDLAVTDEYRPDYELYGMVEEFDRVILEKGKFVVIYPNEPHAPGLAIGEPQRVRKAVIKVKA